MYRLSLVVPVFNEENNILSLVRSIGKNRNTSLCCPFELILVNNGSTDSSSEKLELAQKYGEWIHVVTLGENAGYGGGIQAGFKAISPLSTHVGWFPADHQYSFNAVLRVWRNVFLYPNSVHYGWRTTRLDSSQTQFVSRTYSKLCQIILGIRARDINGLPKIIPVSFLKKIDFPLSTSFLLDGQILLAAQKAGLSIHSHPVTFYARRMGVSSWSSKRLEVYGKTLVELFRIHKQSQKWFFSES